MNTNAPPDTLPTLGVLLGIAAAFVGLVALCALTPWAG